MLSIGWRYWQILCRHICSLEYNDFDFFGQNGASRKYMENWILRYVYEIRFLVLFDIEFFCNLFN
jgi:hypothetical protein